MNGNGLGGDIVGVVLACLLGFFLSTAVHSKEPPTGGPARLPTVLPPREPTRVPPRPPSIERSRCLEVLVKVKEAEPEFASPFAWVEDADLRQEIERSLTELSERKNVKLIRVEGLLEEALKASCPDGRCTVEQINGAIASVLESLSASEGRKGIAREAFYLTAAVMANVAVLKSIPDYLGWAKTFATLLGGSCVNAFGSPLLSKMSAWAAQLAQRNGANRPHEFKSYLELLKRVWKLGQEYYDNLQRDGRSILNGAYMAVNPKIEKARFAETEERGLKYLVLAAVYFRKTYRDALEIHNFHEEFSLDLERFANEANFKTVFDDILDRVRRDEPKMTIDEFDFVKKDFHNLLIAWLKPDQWPRIASERLHFLLRGIEAEPHQKKAIRQIAQAAIYYRTYYRTLSQRSSMASLSSLLAPRFANQESFDDILSEISLSLESQGGTDREQREDDLHAYQRILRAWLKADSWKGDQRARRSELLIDSLEFIP